MSGEWQERGQRRGKQKPSHVLPLHLRVPLAGTLAARAGRLVMAASGTDILTAVRSPAIVGIG
jgi:hypothetical protein